MRWIALLLALLSTVVGLAQSNVQKLMPDDEIELVVVEEKNFSGPYVVLRDGSVTGRGFGRVVVGGKTIEEAARIFRSALSKVLKNPTVYISVSKPRRPTVFLVGARARTGGIIDHRAGMDLRAILAEAEDAEALDRQTATVYRKGVLVAEADVSALLQGSSDGNIVLEPDDVVAVSPKAFMRVWVVGLVMRPGEVRLKGGSNVYQAIAETGGIQITTAGLGARFPSDEDIVISVRRGDQLLAIPVRQDLADKPFVLEAGDTVSVQQSPTCRITVSGEVRIPGEYVVRAGIPIEAAIASASGLSDQGSLGNIVVLRRGEAYQIDASTLAAGGKGSGFSIEDGDAVYVRRSERVVVALGTVARPGRVYLDDGKEYRLTDLLAQAGGLVQGTLRRVFLARAGAGGKFEVKMYDLDKFARDGDLSQNPFVLPNDVVLFSQPGGVTARNLGEIISSALLLDTLLRR